VTIDDERQAGHCAGCVAAETDVIEAG